MNNEDSVESKNSGENTLGEWNDNFYRSKTHLAADNESIERKNEDTSMESGSPNSSESTESENQEESERSVSEDNLEESKEDFLFEIEKNLRNGHYKDYYYSMPPYFNQDHTFKEARRQGKRQNWKKKIFFPQNYLLFFLIFDAYNRKSREKSLYRYHAVR